MAAEDQLFRSLKRHSRLRVDKIASDLVAHGAPLSDVHLSLRSLRHLEKDFAGNDSDDEPRAIGPGAAPAAHEMTADWVAQEERAAAKETLAARSAPAPRPPVSTRTTLAQRRRMRYLALPESVRRISPSETYEEEGAAAAADETSPRSPSPSGSSVQDAPLQKDLILLRRLGKRSMARSTMDYLQLEGRVRTAEFALRVVVTAEQEYRAKRHTRVWRQDVTKIKARHVREQQALDELQVEPVSLYESAAHQAEAAADLAALLQERGVGRSAMDDIVLGRRDAQIDNIYEDLLFERLQQQPRDAE
ncbi:hypothetical protein EXIGLDRAFT_727765 [Exidia glandulosa HHB12029]|uniref:Uncharacterized protein n=1 Tax=Exidia glandulosa HHB12029 TaxID=1314781 RepID=A0A165D7K5_EXIGL|nr:hypothetical protein EXIGLDRAFT_727765 [Exidia glandulosa HHB12029]